jgi:sugar O-acyltransferase (sialic acid O-acetyltransferase NeuD family)
MRDVFIVGTGGLARETAQILKLLQINGEIGKFAGYISQDNEEIGKELVHGEVVGTDATISFVEEDIDIVIAIGYPSIKEKVAYLYESQRNTHFPNIIDPRANIDPTGFKIGRGNIITCGSYSSSQVSIGNFNLVNWNATIGHDVRVGSYCVINPGAHISGLSIINDSVLIGAGAVVLERINICQNVIIGAGAVVTKDINEAATYIGIPAQKALKK